jgi:excisionase family DNA binding protein
VEDAILHSIAAGASRLGIGRTLMYELIADGRIATVTIGRRRLIHREELERFADELRGL